MKERIDFFISHSHVDKKWAEWVSSILKKYGYTTFWGTRDLKVGDDFALIIKEYLEKANNLVAILSPSYFNSMYCQAEVSAILANGNKKIIPVKVTDKQPEGSLANLLYVDIYNVSEQEAEHRLIKAIEHLEVNKDQNPSEKLLKDGNRQDINIGNKFPGNYPFSNLKFPLEVNENFVCGEEKILAIRQAFNANNTVSSNLSLSGAGGIGKTTIAINYIYQFFDEYNLIWWVNASTYASVLDAYKHFLVQINLADKKSVVNDKDIIDLTNEWMEKNSDWLFVFDDVADYEIIQLFIPQKHCGNILITTRNLLWKTNNINQISIDVLSTEAAMLLLKKQGVDITDKSATTLIEKLGHLPLELNLAAQYIVENKCTIQQFLDMCESKEYQGYEKNEIAEIYYKRATVLKEQKKYIEAIDCYQEALKIYEQQMPECKVQCINIYFDMAEIYCDTKEYGNALQIYQNVLGKECDHIDFKTPSLNLCKLYNNIGTVYFEQGNNSAALNYYKKALEISYEVVGMNHPFLGTVYSNIAAVHTKCGDYSIAQDYNYKAIEIRKKILGNDHPDTISSYINSAEVYELEHDYETALETYKRVLEIYNNTLTEENSCIIPIYKSIAGLYQKLGRYQESLDFYNKVLQYTQERKYESKNVITNNINIVSPKNETITQITNLDENNFHEEKISEELDIKTIAVLQALKDANDVDYMLFNRNFNKLIEKIKMIKGYLTFEKKSNIEICHYSKLSTLRCIIKGKDQKQAKFRISNIAYLNDPSEGNIFWEVLSKYINPNVKEAFLESAIKRDKLIEVPFSKVFIGSFTTAKNKLPMWTLYGDDSKGCCLVFDDYFFEKNKFMEISSSQDEGAFVNQDLTLYKVMYVDVNDVNEKDLIIANIKQIGKLINVLEELIIKYECVKEWIHNLLDEIKFLFKDSDYDYENEVRIILYADDSEIKADEGDNVLHIPKLFVELQKKLSYKEIILGSKVEKAAEVAPFLLHSGMVDKVTKSGIHYQ